MFIKTFSLIALLALNACSGTKSASTANTSNNSSEWIELFDGRTTNGWHAYGKRTVGKGWEISNGAVHLNPAAKDGGDLTTDAAFENFHLQLEWKIAKGGNSGIIFLVQEDSSYKHSFLTGPEMQVLDNGDGTAANPGHPDGKNYKHRAGDLYDLMASSKEVAKPTGEWNKAEIIVNRGDLQLFLNGTQVVRTSMWTDEWNRLVAASKFKDWKGFGKYRSGKISLQDHGDEVWYRNIRIKKL